MRANQTKIIQCQSTHFSFSSDIFFLLLFLPLFYFSSSPLLFFSTYCVFVCVTTSRKLSRTPIKRAWYSPLFSSKLSLSHQHTYTHQARVFSSLISHTHRSSARVLLSSPFLSFLFPPNTHYHPSSCQNFPLRYFLLLFLFLLLTPYPSTHKDKHIFSLFKTLTTRNPLPPLLRTPASPNPWLSLPPSLPPSPYLSLTALKKMFHPKPLAFENNT